MAAAPERCRAAGGSNNPASVLLDGARHRLADIVLWPLADGARLASGVFVGLALVLLGRTARTLYGAEVGWAAVLTLLVFGLVRGHELNAYTAQFAAAAMMLFGLVHLPQGRYAAGMLGGGAVLMLLAGGAAEAILFLLLALVLPWLLMEYRTTHNVPCFGLVALPCSARWPGWRCSRCSRSRLGRHSMCSAGRGYPGQRPGFYLGILGWYAWPAWPMAAWAVYRARRQWRTPRIVLPMGMLIGLLGLYALDAHPGEEQGLILLLPLALLGAAGLLTLRRGAAYALLSFGAMLFGFLALVIWVYWSAHDLGPPSRLAGRLTQLGITDVGKLRPWSLVLGVPATLSWIGILSACSARPCARSWCGRAA